ncbi:MAG: hypothetical protein QOE90_1886 [Thermoplasmata archaeon]|jgi:predicted ribosome quality control (RQC) complex YloA/Tae2 family protein|nr:hypothetical protein [Thermoplasmata archaeon]
MSALDVRACVRELKGFRGARLDKAYEIAPGELLLRWRGGPPGTPPKKLDLSILVGKAVHWTTLPREAPEKPTSFVMNLRKHLANAFLDDARQHGFDRVIELVSNRKDGKYVLVVELFHDGNVVLVKDDRILTPLNTQSWATREVRPGAEWVPAPARQDPSTLSAEEFAARVRASNADAVRTLATEMNLGGPVAEEVCAQAGVPKNRTVAELSERDITALREAVKALLDRVDGGALDPIVVLEGEKKVDVAPFPVAAHAGLTLQRFPTFHEALDAYFGRASTTERVDPRLKKLEAERAKVQRMLDAQDAALVKFAREETEAKRKADLLYGHFETVNRVTKTLWDAGKSLGWKAVQERLKEGRKAGNPEAVLVESLSPNEGFAVLSLEDLDGKKGRVRVDLRKTVQENADRQYETAKKMREKTKGAIAARERTLVKMKELDERGLEIVAALQEKAQRKKATKTFWFEQFRWFYTSDGHLVLAGRDVKSNERIVAKQLEENDRYLHADVSGAPSTVVKAKDGTVSDLALQEAACFAASNSRIWNAGHAAGEAYWVTPAQVSKTPNPGEFVAKGSFIIRGKRNFLRVPIRLALGEVVIGPELLKADHDRPDAAASGRVEIEGHRKVMGGPVAALAARSQRYLVVEPGDTATNQVANEVAQALGVNVEEAQAVMPPGPVRIVERHGL